MNLTLQKYLLAAARGFRMHEAFDGAPGVAYDFVSAGGLTQDRGGLTPVSAAAQNIGLAHDYSRASSGWVSSTELVTNGTFDSDVAGWAEAFGAGASIAWDTGRLRLTTNAASGCRAYQVITTVPNRVYRISITATAGTASSSGYRVTADAAGGPTGQIAAETAVGANWSREIVFVATGAATTIALLSADTTPGGETCFFDNISVREITGNPLIAPTDARRGTWNTMPNGLPCLALNGTSHAYATAAAVNPGANDEVHVWAAVRALANATQYIAESGPGSGDGTWVLLRVGGSGAYFAVSRGTQTLSGSSALCPAPNSSVLYQRSKISTPVLTLARNGITDLTNTSTQGTGNYTSQIINIGARNAASPSSFFNGQIARAVIRYGPISADQKAIIDGLVMQGFAPSP